MENVNSIWGFIGIIVFACGVYAIYSYIKMKKDGEINASILLGKDYIYKKCKKYVYRQFLYRYVDYNPMNQCLNKKYYIPPIHIYVPK